MNLPDTLVVALQRSRVDATYHAASIERAQLQVYDAKVWNNVVHELTGKSITPREFMHLFDHCLVKEQGVVIWGISRDLFWEKVRKREIPSWDMMHTAITGTGYVLLKGVLTSVVLYDVDEILRQVGRIEFSNSDAVGASSYITQVVSAVLEHDYTAYICKPIFQFKINE